MKKSTKRCKLNFKQPNFHFRKLTFEEKEAYAAGEEIDQRIDALGYSTQQEKELGFGVRPHPQGNLRRRVPPPEPRFP